MTDLSATEQSKQAVMAFFDTANRVSYREALSRTSDELQWWTSATTYDKAQMLAIADALADQITAPIRFETGTVTAQDDRVAIEAKSFCVRKSGVPYENVYHFLFRVRDGVIVEIREHCDTAYAAKVWADAIG